MKDEVLKHRIFAIGDVVVHQRPNTRCVVVGWQVDEATGEQYLSLLVDQLDAHSTFVQAIHCWSTISESIEEEKR